MPTINDATVVASAYDTSGNGGRHLTRLSNGWLVAGTWDNGVGSTYYIRFIVSKDNGQTWSQLCTGQNRSGSVISLVSKGTMVYCVISSAGSNAVFSMYFDATTVTNTALSDTIIETQTTVGGISLTYNASDNTLHAAWASKNSTYANSFNIRYAKGTINADGSVTWGAVEQVTIRNVGGYGFQNPTISLNSSGIPCIIAEGLQLYQSGTSFTGNGTVSSITIFKRDQSLPAKSSTDTTTFSSGSSWSGGNVYYSNAGTLYAQSNPSAIFAPQSINGLANGRIECFWHGTNSTQTTYPSLYYSYSDDVGVTWSTGTILIQGSSTIYPQLPSPTMNKNGVLTVVFFYYANAVGNVGEMAKTNGTWGNPVIIKSRTDTSNTLPSSLFDSTFSVNFSSPLFIYKDTAKVGFYGTWTVTTISVTQGPIGTVSDKTNVLTYSITTDGTMGTITESVNGTVVGTKNIASGVSTLVGLTQAQWDAIKYGQYANATGGLNTLTVSMNDGSGVNTFTYTFDKRLATTDDILHAIQATQDSQTMFIPSVKSQLASAITAKGGTSQATDSFATMVSAINAISLGKKWASGTANTDSTGQLTVSGLAFIPSIIITIGGSVTSPDIGLFVKNFASSYQYVQQNGSNAGTWYSITVNSTGFTIHSVPTSNSLTNVQWYAFE